MQDKHNLAEKNNIISILAFSILAKKHESIGYT